MRILYLHKSMLNAISVVSFCQEDSQEYIDVKIYHFNYSCDRSKNQYRGLVTDEEANQIWRSRRIRQLFTRVSATELFFLMSIPIPIPPIDSKDDYKLYQAYITWTYSIEAPFH